MPKYLFVYHGGKAPESPEEGQAVMAKWLAWRDKMGDAVVDFGAPAGPSKTVQNGSVLDGGGVNPASGYSLISAGDIDAAVAHAQGCPILDDGGSIEVAEAMGM